MPGRNSRQPFVTSFVEDGSSCTYRLLHNADGGWRSTFASSPPTRETSGTCDIRASAKPLTERFEHSSSASACDLPPVIGIHRDRGMCMAELIGCCP